MIKSQLASLYHIVCDFFMEVSAVDNATVLLMQSCFLQVSESRGAIRRGGSTATSTGSSSPTPSHHPPVLDPLGAALDGSDPLSLFALSQDPLSAMVAETVGLKLVTLRWFSYIITIPVCHVGIVRIFLLLNSKFKHLYLSILKFYFHYRKLI